MIRSTSLEAITPQFTMQDIAQFADSAAMSTVLTDYQETQADETIRRQKTDLDCYASYLAAAGVQAGDLMNNLSAWHGVSYGIVAGFKRWMVQVGYSTGTVNVRLATVKRYVALAVAAGEVPRDTLAAVKLVKGYTPKDARHVDAKREQTRQENSKKSKHTEITRKQAEALKRQLDTRDRLLMCLFIDHGFRCGEVAILKVEDMDMSKKHIHIYRPKVENEGKQDMSKDVIEVLPKYLAEYQPTGFLFKGDSKETGQPGSYGVRGINRRVQVLGEAAGIENLSPHDLRHYWAMDAAERGIHINRLRQAGGWRTLAMPDRYIGNTEIENKGMV